MEAVIWIQDADREARWNSSAERWRQALTAETDLQLVDSLNREVGNNGWVSARAVYLKVLWDELHARGIDFSAVDDLACFPGDRTFVLLDKQLVYATPAGRSRFRVRGRVA